MSSTEKRGSARINTEPIEPAPVPVSPVVAEPDNIVDAAVDILQVRHQVSRDDAVELLQNSTRDQDRQLTEVA